MHRTLSLVLLGAIALTTTHCGDTQGAANGAPDAASDRGIGTPDTAQPGNDARPMDDARTPEDTPGRGLPDAVADAPSVDAGRPLDAALDRAPDASRDASLPDAVADVTLPDAPRDAPLADADDPLVAGLYDPARPSAAQECAGTPLTLDEIIGALDPGTAMMFIGPRDYASYLYDSVARGAFALQEHRQQCTRLTGCAPWTVVNGGGGRGLILGLEVSADRTLRARPYSDFSSAITYSPFVIDDGDFLVDYAPANLRFLARVRVTRRVDGSLCASAATPTFTYHPDADTTVQSYNVSQITLRPARTARTALTDPPPSDASPQICDGTPASDAMIASAWFAAGATSASFSGRPTYRRGAYRSCHPLTACSTWTDYAGSEWPALTGLSISDGHISVSGNVYSNWLSARLNSGSFTGTVADFAVEGLVSTTCAGQRSVARESRYVLGPDVVWERYGRERIDVH